ncbi:MAG: formylglycine-generating enzyme family protein [Actinomycetota bacterium]
MWKTILLLCCALSAVPGQEAAAGILPKDSTAQYELAFWNSIKDSTHPEDYESYLRAYPNGRFAPLARGRIERLRASLPKADLPPVTAAPAPAPASPPASPPIPRPVKRKSRPMPAKPAPAAAPVPEPAVTAPPVPPTVKEIKDCATCPALVELPAGLFTMGSDSGGTPEKPVHSVALGTNFAIGRTEVTMEQWEACADAGACPPITDDATARDTDPVRNVNWDDTQRYIQWLSRTTGKAYRLPTEAEWEYAARGGAADVGPFADNPYGLKDMTGSVWEWVSDCWHSSYMGAPPDGSNWDEPGCPMRVIRGGAELKGVPLVTAATRWRYFPSVRDPHNGFRVARDMQ